MDLNADPADIYLLNVNNGNTRAMYEICSKLAIKAPKFLVFWCFLEVQN